MNLRTRATDGECCVRRAARDTALTIGRTSLAVSIAVAYALTLFPWASGFRTWLGDPNDPAFAGLQWFAALYLSFVFASLSAQLAIQYLGGQESADRGMALCLALVCVTCALLHIRIYWEDGPEASGLALCCPLIMFAAPSMLRFVRALTSKVARSMIEH